MCRPFVTSRRYKQNIPREQQNRLPTLSLASNENKVKICWNFLTACLTQLHRSALSGAQFDHVFSFSFSAGTCALADFGRTLKGKIHLEPKTTNEARQKLWRAGKRSSYERRDEHEMHQVRSVFAVTWVRRGIRIFGLFRWYCTTKVRPTFFNAKRIYVLSLLILTEKPKINKFSEVLGRWEPCICRLLSLTHQ